MDTMRAFSLGQANRGKEEMVFDWDRAARRIRETQPEVAAAGLRNDWGYTGGEIYRAGEPVPKGKTYTYLSSTWAVPELELDGVKEPCYRMESECPQSAPKCSAWDAHTYWPESALAILKEGPDRG